MSHFHRALQRARTWTSGSDTRRLLSATALVGGLTLVARLGTVAQDLFAAARFGTGDAMDALLLAYAFPTFAVNVVAISITASLIPGFIRAKEEGGVASAQRLVSNVLGRTTVVLLAVVALLALLMPLLIPLFARGFSASKIALTLRLFYIVLPVVLLSGWSNLLSAVLNAGERFAITSIVPMVAPLTAIAAVLFGTRTFGIYAFAAGLLAGSAIELAITGRAVRAVDVRPALTWLPLSSEEQKVMRQYPALVAGGLLMSGSTIIDQAMAASLGAGSIAALTYGRKGVSLILAISSLALGTAVFSRLSTLVARQDWTGVRATIRTYAAIIVLLAVPGTLLLIAVSKPLVRLLFERGAFHAADTAVVAHVQMALAIQIPFYLAGILGVRLLSAMHRNDILMKITAVNAVTNVVLNYVFMKWLGIVGIALSTSFVYFLSMTIVIFAARRQFRLLQEAAT